MDRSLILDRLTPFAKANKPWNSRLILSILVPEPLFEPGFFCVRRQDVQYYPQRPDYPYHPGIGEYHISKSAQTVDEVLRIARETIGSIRDQPISQADRCMEGEDDFNPNSDCKSKQEHGQGNRRPQPKAGKPKAVEVKQAKENEIDRDDRSEEPGHKELP